MSTPVLGIASDLASIVNAFEQADGGSSGGQQPQSASDSNLFQQLAGDAGKAASTAGTVAKIAGEVGMIAALF